MLYRRIVRFQSAQRKVLDERWELFRRAVSVFSINCSHQETKCREATVGREAGKQGSTRSLRLSESNKAVGFYFVNFHQRSVDPHPLPPSLPRSVILRISMFETPAPVQEGQLPPNPPRVGQWGGHFKCKVGQMKMERGRLLHPLSLTGVEEGEGGELRV